MKVQTTCKFDGLLLTHVVMGQLKILSPLAQIAKLYICTREEPIEMSEPILKMFSKSFVGIQIHYTTRYNYSFILLNFILLNRDQKSSSLLLSQSMVVSWPPLLVGLN